MLLDGSRRRTDRPWRKSTSRTSPAVDRRPCSSPMNDFLSFCPTCKVIYEVVRHHVRPPAEPICEGCQQDLPIADDSDLLTERAFDLSGQNSVARSPLKPRR